MKLHRFIGNFNLNEGSIEIKDSNLTNQIIKVLRLKGGDKFILSNGQLNEAQVQITRISKNSIVAEIIKKYKNQNEPKRKVTLYCAILKRENFELVAQKATEVGISEIVPVITERTIKTGLNIERLQKIIKEAAEQSGRGIVPALHEPIDFKEAVKNRKQNDCNFLFHPNEALLFGMPCERDGANTSKFSAENYACIPGSKAEVGLFIGPEGGFSEAEIKLARENNLKIASLGKLTLRAETATIVVSYLATQ